MGASDCVYTEKGCFLAHRRRGRHALAGTPACLSFCAFLCGLQRLGQRMCCIVALRCTDALHTFTIVRHFVHVYTNYTYM